MKLSEKSRFDIRLTQDLKDSFEYAANIGGYSTLTEFVLSSVQRQANEIIEKHNAILASAKDQQIFFDALMDADQPNNALTKAATRYKKSLTSK
jgi:uncharacterized protein (DUF1778 family)